MNTPVTPIAPAFPNHAVGRSSSRADRVLPRLIVGAGTLCFVLLAWGHLGLGAWLFPPAPTVAQQTVIAGPYQVALSLDSGQLTVGGSNTVSLRLQDQRGHAITDAAVQIAPEMMSMPMTAPTVGAAAQTAGAYLARPMFSMAGNWRLRVSITVPGQPSAQAVFIVSVRWK